MPNFGILGVSCSPLFLEMAKIWLLLWPKHGPNMVPQIGFSLILIDVPKDAPCQI